jgi:hypothetical protein
MLAVSPLGGVTIRHRQSSVITDTHCPVMSIRAPSRGLVTLGAGCCAIARALLTATRNMTTHADVHARGRRNVATVIALPP